jgi:tRNA A-37 threonylcarbamoyl transferase component Bud32
LVSEPPPPNTFHDGRYAVTKLLGEGGQATSYQAVDERADRLVVVKRFRIRGAKSWKEVELAEREAKVLSGLEHASLPRYVEHFEEGGELFLVTEYIDGESLAALRKRGERLAAGDVERFLRTSAGTLDYLHGRAPPVVHRDIKPSNVLMRPDRSFAIIDFGAVRDRMKPEGGSTIVGTFGYMAPEQFQGRAMPASDVYAVGATALVLLTGVEPEDLPHKGLAIDVRAALKGVSVEPWLVRALEQMLDPNPDTRASSIGPLLGAPQVPPPKARERRDPAPVDEDEINPWPFRDRDAERARRRSARAQRKAERRAARGKDWVRGYGRPLELGGPIAWVVHVALLVAQIAVRVALRGVVSPLLVALSGIFGRTVREAAETVRESEREAQDEIARARAYTIGKPQPNPRASADSERGAQKRMRVAEREPPPAPTASHDAEAELLAEAEAEAEDAVRGTARKVAR